MSKNFDKICRLCMSITECMLPLFEDSSILPEKIMVLIPTLKVKLCSLIIIREKIRAREKKITNLFVRFEVVFVKYT